MISLNGIAIPHQTLDQLKWIENNSPPDELNLWDRSFGRQGLTLMLPPRVQQPPPRIGVLSWPLDASRWATFQAIISEDQLLQIDPQYPGVANTYVSGSSADTLCNDRFWTLVLDEGPTGFPGRKITTVLHPLTPVPLQDIPGKIKYYLVTLVDERFYWWWRAGQTHVTEGVTSWTDLINMICTIVEISPTVDAIDPAFDRPTRLFNFDFLDSPLMLDAAAWALGMRVVRLFDGTVWIQSPENAKVGYDSQFSTWAGDQLSGGQSNTSYLVWDVPEKVLLSFNKVYAGNIISGQFSVTVDLNSTNIPEFANVGGRCGTLPVFAQSLANFTAADGSGTPTNLSTLQAYAQIWAQKFYKWFLRRPNMQYAGIVPFAPDGMVDAIEVHHHAEENQHHPLYNPGAHRVTTRILPVQWNWLETGNPVNVSGTPTGFWARLTGKSYPPFSDIVYTFVPVTDSDDPTPITWTDGPTNALPAFEANNNDIAVSPPGGGIYSGSTDNRPTIVWMQLGSEGDYYLFVAEPRVDLCEIRSGGGGIYGGVQLGYNDGTGQLFDFEPVILIDANLLP